MKKVDCSWMSEKDKRLVKEGRGKVGLEQYTPWIKTDEFASRGRVTRINGYKVKRIYHLLSDLQLRAFLVFENSENVLDIRESFPLLDMMEVIDEKTVRLDKFVDKETKEKYVLTTNFLLTVNCKTGVRLEARTIKHSVDLGKKIVQEKLEIERQYWTVKGIDFKVITEKQLPRQYCENISWVRETLLYNENESIDLDDSSRKLAELISEYPEITLIRLLSAFEKDNGLEEGMALYIFRYSIASKKIEIDMNQKVLINRKCKELVLNVW